MTNPRDILNEYKWKENLNFEDLEIIFVHRGGLNNTKKIFGCEILKVGRSFIHTSSAMIPFHRINLIVYNGKNIFRRK